MKSKKGFTIVELMAVVIILVFLSLMSIAIVSKISERSRMRAFVKEANVIARAAVNKYYDDKILDETVRDDMYNGTANGKVCYSIPDNLIGKYVVKDQNEKYRGSVELCYASNCTYQTKVWLTNGKKYYINGKTSIKDENDIDHSTNIENFESCGYDTIGSYRGSPSSAEFDYTGDEQRLTVLKNGYYKLEVWGAQGGSQAPNLGGFGAYSYGEYELKKGDVLYINVGGQGNSNCSGNCSGGYNGGGSSTNGWASGGGATSITLESGTINTAPEFNSKNHILIVASGGGGVHSTSQNDYKHGMGICPSDWSCARYSPGSAKTNSAGGGGYKGINTDWTGAGGISYTSNSKLRNGVTYCYKCYESTNASMRTVSSSDRSIYPKSKVPKLGNGYAKITYLGSYQIAYVLDGGKLAEFKSNPGSYSVETDDFTLNNPSKVNYDFIGWSDGTNLFNRNSSPYKSGYYLTNTGAEVSNADFAIYQVSVEPNSKYFLFNSGNTRDPSYAIYDASGNLISAKNYNKTKNLTFTTPNNASYIRFSVITKSNRSDFDRTTFRIEKVQETVTIPKGSSGNKSFTARYTPVIYNITYNLNGSTVSESNPNPTTYNVETPTFTLVNPTRDGYAFIGWTGSNGSTAQSSVSINNGSIGDKTYNAFLQKFAKVTFDYNVPEYTFEKTTSSIMETKTLFNYDYDMIIDMVYNLPTSGRRYLLIGNYNASANMNLEINTSNKVRVFESGDRSFTSELTIGEDVHGVLTYTANGKAYTYDFTSASSSGTTSGTFRQSGWTGNTFRIGQDYRGAADFTGYTLKSLKITHYYVPSKFPSNVTLPGYTFDGWYTAAVGGTLVTAENIGSYENQTVYAHWTLNE